jgi:hypothetical protein
MRIRYRVAGLVLKLLALPPVPSAGLPLNGAAMMGMVLETSELILVNIAEDSLKIEGAED